MVFWMRPPPAHSLRPPFLCKWKVLRWYICHAVSFTSDLHISKVFLVAESTISGCFQVVFFGCNPPKCGQSGLKFWQVMECKAMHQVYDSFYSILKKRSKFDQKNWFSGSFLEFFHYALLRPSSYAPIFCQIKGLMVIHNCGKFHQYSISGSQVINFQMFLWRCSIHEIAPLGGGFSPPNMARFCWKFHQRQSIVRQR